MINLPSNNLKKGKMIEQKILSKVAWLREMKDVFEGYIRGAVWVDNGRGGCVNKERELSRIEAKIEVLEEILSHRNNQE